MTPIGPHNWKGNLDYEVNLGLIFPNMVYITKEGLTYKNRLWDFSSITRLRWGKIDRYIRKVYHHSTYTIYFGNQKQLITLNFRNNEKDYNRFLESLWKTAGIEIYNQCLKGLREGKSYQFGRAKVNDLGIVLEKKKTFSRNQYLFSKWEEIIITTHKDHLYVHRKDNKNYTAKLYYLKNDNINIFEKMFRSYLDLKKDERISSIIFP
jgi:hypothetical protein